MMLEYHWRRFNTYKYHVARCWPGVDPYPITVDKLMRLINDKKDAMSYGALLNLICSQCKHPSHGSDWHDKVVKDPRVLALLNETRVAAKNRKQQTPQSMNNDSPTKVSLKSNKSIQVKPARGPGRPLGAINKPRNNTSFQSKRRPGRPQGSKNKKPACSHRKRVRFAVEKPEYDVDNAEIPSRASSSNNPLGLPAVWYPFNYQSRYPSSMPALTLVASPATQSPPQNLCDTAFLCHPILQPQYR
ncbi:hypothetical protein K492DRAFT_204114 [Lichtheimia hyalospora FSU 10163]|nr:hypothetical protein K492DRAFT_204114 [Lichtheimia hyalospora FSU 10163]